MIGNDFNSVLKEALLPGGLSLYDSSERQPLLLVFLRHSGCTFCRETLAKLTSSREQLEKQEIRIVLVHMADDAEAQDFFGKYGLQDLWRISDPERRIYRAFGLRKGTLGQVLGARVWSRGIFGGALLKHGIGAGAGDVFQMPGVFVLFKGEVVFSHVPESAAQEALFEVSKICSLG